MMNEELEILMALENVENHEVVDIPRDVHVYRNGFRVSDKKFIKNYRLSKDLATNLINLLNPLLNQREHLSALRTEEKVLIALNFFATGSYQANVGNSKYLGVSQSTVTRCVEEITEALNRPEMFNRFIKFPQNMNELNQLRIRFHRKYGMPGIIGCIDGTHVAIVPPRNDPEHPEHIYVNRKNYHSLNVQLVCDENMQILHVNARFPGSSHDSYIWRNSNIEPILRNMYDRGIEGYFLLGDSGYPLRPWLLTPLAHPQNEEEERYNETHRSARSTIERCNGLLKMRFRCLSKHRVLHYTPRKASRIINACIVLHNMCIINNVELPQDGDDVQVINEDENDIFEDNNQVNPHLLDGRRIQRRVINYFR
ncbi:hypothetical protein NQ315_013008 [Exocentrus adspersus]|uniref:DDE Tnp4 domain-containing protein n=1 Tax=Exocentrus adspersus TaxID=1586481 RepID=A0AAV8VSI6_9CUCU|nr:hypothetical protein NQ315_013008 [Exocentrus adspersus]